MAGAPKAEAAVSCACATLAWVREQDPVSKQQTLSPVKGGEERSSWKGDKSELSLPPG